jgi:hypothetical protein
MINKILFGTLCPFSSFNKYVPYMCRDAKEHTMFSFGKELCLHVWKACGQHYFKLVPRSVLFLSEFCGENVGIKISLFCRLLCPERIKGGTRVGQGADL